MARYACYTDDDIFIMKYMSSVREPAYASEQLRIMFNPRDVINVASVPHRSPFRYPGGKTWLVPHVRRWLTSVSSLPREFVEPFAGGAIGGLNERVEHAFVAE